MEHRIINIAKDFSYYPGGRHGPLGGEKFRRDFLEPVLAAGLHAKISFDGARGYDSSFLEEAFGGLVREGFSSQKVLDAFDFASKDESIIDEIREYITDAKR